MAVPFDPELIRQQFPFIREQAAQCVYLDNAAMTQKPQRVIDATLQFYTGQNINVHRATHPLAQQTTDAYEAIRRTTPRQNARSTRRPRYILRY